MDKFNNLLFAGSFYNLRLSKGYKISFKFNYF